MPQDRAQSAYRFRVEAAELARNRDHPKHQANGDEARYGAACYPMSFTKGLEHNADTGLVANPAHFEAFRTAIDNGFAEPFTTRVPVPHSDTFGRRQWEAPTAGLVYELEGPDPQAVTMPPAPELGSDELTYEMAEVYELAMLRDVPFTEFEGTGMTGDVFEAADRLNKLPYTANDFADGRGRKTNSNGQLDPQTAFRGSSPGVEQGPYLSQFMLIGSRGNPAEGKIGYGAQIIDQRVLQAKVDDDYMMKWEDWLEVQHGYDVRTPGASPVSGQVIFGDPRFICTPRDLATYVHVDQLYQAYLNACLLLLGQGTPFDPAFDLLSGSNGHSVMVNAASDEHLAVNAGGFALWGGPHILSLVTEVATRGLKAVRFQKFNNHLRLRPEALAARLEKAAEIEARNPSICGRLTKMLADLSMEPGAATPKTVDAIKDHNQSHANGGTPNALLPMAFEEGSPMHPTYGAGHATVAGACVTILKAFFDTSAIFVQITDCNTNVAARFLTKSQIIQALKNGATVHFGAYRAVKAPTKDDTAPVDSYLDFVACGHFDLELNDLGDREKARAEAAFGEAKTALETAQQALDDAKASEDVTAIVVAQLKLADAETDHETAKGSPFLSSALEDLDAQYLEAVSVPKPGPEQCCPLTLEGELNKLAANISIGRNMAGVHYYSDYFDSVRMGEEIALGILEEQALGYQTDPFVLSVPTFDGETVRIGRR